MKWSDADHTGILQPAENKKLWLPETFTDLLVGQKPPGHHKQYSGPSWPA